MTGQKGKCYRCTYKKAIGDTGRIQCMHPRVVSILNELPERKPGLILARALRMISKDLHLRLRADCLINDYWFNFPFCYRPDKIAGFSGYEKLAVIGQRAEKHRKRDRCTFHGKGNRTEVA